MDRDCAAQGPGAEAKGESREEGREGAVGKDASSHGVRDLLGGG